MRDAILKAINKERERAKQIHSPFKGWVEADRAISGEQRELFYAMLSGDRLGKDGIITEAIQLAGTCIKAIEDLCSEEEIQRCLQE